METVRINKKYIIILLILPFILSTHFRGSKSGLPPAWGEESIANTEPPHEHQLNESTHETANEKWQTLVETCDREQIPGEDLNRMLDVFRQAKAAGFADEPFLDKALEGIAKQISPPVILQVLHKRLEQFRTCQNILQQMLQQTPKAEKEAHNQKYLSILTESLDRGVSVSELKELSRLAPQPRSVTLTNSSENLATLKNLGFSSADALEIVQCGLRYGLYKQRNREMALTIRQARQKGVSTQELKKRILSTLMSGNSELSTN